MRLTKKKVEKIKQAIADGTKQTEIAKRFKASRSVVSDIATGRVHKDVEWPAGEPPLLWKSEWDEGRNGREAGCGAPVVADGKVFAGNFAGKVFCLVDAPSKEAAAAVHREAHGLLADEIIEVKEGK